MNNNSELPGRAPAVSDELIAGLAHRHAWRYKMSSDPHHSDTYTFNGDCLIAFARALLREVEPVAWLCSFVREDESTRQQVVMEDPACTRWADDPDGDGVSPYSVQPLYTHPAPAERGAVRLTLRVEQQIAKVRRCIAETDAYDAERAAHGVTEYCLVPLGLTVGEASTGTPREELEAPAQSIQGREACESPFSLHAPGLEASRPARPFWGPQ